MRRSVFGFMLGLWAMGSMHVTQASERFRIVRGGEGQAIAIVDSSMQYRRGLKDELAESYTAFQNMLAQASVKGAGDILEDARKVAEAPEDKVDFQAASENMLGHLRGYWRPNTEKALDMAMLDKIAPVLEQLEKDILKKLPILDYSTVARMDRPGYFYKRNLFRSAFKRAMSLTRDLLPASRVLDYVLYFLRRYEDHLYDTRTQRQNMLLQILSTHTPAEMGLTDKEWEKAYSSIYEANIGPLSFWEYLKARKNWARYGLKKHRDRLKEVAKRKSKYASNFSEVGEGLTSMHYAVLTKDKGPAIVDFLTKRSVLDKRYSASFYYDHPKQVLGKRLYFELVLFAQDLLPLPGIIISILKHYTSSKLSGQVKAEGQLFAYFESQGKNDLAQRILLQSINPVALGIERAWREINRP